MILNKNEINIKQWEKNFCIFILTYWRPNNVVTIKTLKKSWYTWDLYLICSDDDDSLEEYKKNYPWQVIVFHKDDKYWNTMDVWWNKQIVLYARNINFKIAKELWYKYFQQLDDDYVQFKYVKCFNINWKNKKKLVKIQNYDEIVEIFLEFLKISKIKSVCFSQFWDYIWWDYSIWKYCYRLRKIMNSFFFKTDVPVEFLWRINEDVNLYISQWIIWDLFFTIPQISLQQQVTQQNKKWLTDVYKDLWTFVKSFYTVMLSPSSVKVSGMWVTNYRFHHQINWNNTIPCLITNNKIWTKDNYLKEF